MRIASRMVGRETWKSSMSCPSEGRLSPVWSSPVTIARRMRRETSSAVFGTRTGTCEATLRRYRSRASSGMSCLTN
jgi:hypothetical protein